MRRRGTVGNIAAGGDVSALQFGDPERIAECVVTDDIRHQGDAERIFALAEHAEMPAQVQRCADRGEEFRVGRKVVIGQRAQNLVRIDMSPALRIEPFDQLRDMVQIPRRIVGQELLLREIGFQITLPALFRREVRQPAVIKAAPLAQTAIVNQARYRARSLPAAGALLKPEDRGETQISLL